MFCVWWNPIKILNGNIFKSLNYKSVFVIGNCQIICYLKCVTLALQRRFSSNGKNKIIFHAFDIYVLIFISFQFVFNIAVLKTAGLVEPLRTTVWSWPPCQPHLSSISHFQYYLTFNFTFPIIKKKTFNWSNFTFPIIKGNKTFNWSPMKEIKDN